MGSRSSRMSLMELYDYALEEELFRYLPGSNGRFAISNYGRVVSLTKMNGRPYFTRGYKTQAGYRAISIANYNNKGVSKSVFVHRAVADIFVPGREDGLVVNHVDGNKQNNMASNLEWVSPSSNSIHAYLIGLKVPKMGSEHPHAKLTEVQVINMRHAADTVSPEKLADLYGIRKAHCVTILERKIWRHI